MSSESKFVTCPVCNKEVFSGFINQHLDRNCEKGQAVISLKRTASEKQDGDNSSSSNSKVIKTDHNDTEGVVVTVREPSTPNIPSPSTQALTPKDEPRTSAKGSGGGGIKNQRYRPLADRMRPQTLGEFSGQDELLGSSGILRSLIENDRIPSMIFWGPPGTGKTTLARIIANTTNAYFKEMSAVVQSSGDVKKFIEEAFRITSLTKKRVVLFVDEIHRFNKLQQDTFLPYVERGQVILIGATTENPSFKLNGALLSRCRTFVLKKLEDRAIAMIAKRALTIKNRDAGISGYEAKVDNAIFNSVARLSDGDARTAINIIDIAYDASSNGTITEDGLRQALQRTHVLYNEEEHYDLISALHKSVRGSDDNAALYWLGRMLVGGDDPLYIARRLVRMASEDIGLADNGALPLAVSAFQACQQIGMPECDTILAHCTAYLARAPKSVETYKAYNRVKTALKEDNLWPVPMHLRNAPTKLMKDLGYSKGYKYNPDYDEPVDQCYLPEQIKDVDFFS